MSSVSLYDLLFPACVFAQSWKVPGSGAELLLLVPPVFCWEDTRVPLCCTRSLTTAASALALLFWHREQAGMQWNLSVCKHGAKMLPKQWNQPFLFQVLACLGARGFPVWSVQKQSSAWQLKNDFFSSSIVSVITKLFSTCSVQHAASLRSQTLLCGLSRVAKHCRDP